MVRGKISAFVKAALILFVIAVLLMYIIYEMPFMKRRAYPLRYSDYIIKYSGKYHVDPYLVMSVIWVESKYNCDATSQKQARGLMQITPETGEWIAGKMGIKDYKDELLYDPNINIQIGCWYLNNLHKQFNGDIKLVLAAYNGGMGNVRKWLKDDKYSKDGKNLDYIPFKETREYVEKVLDAYKEYKKLYNI